MHRVPTALSQERSASCQGAAHALLAQPAHLKPLPKETFQADSTRLLRKQQTLKKYKNQVVLFFPCCGSSTALQCGYDFMRQKKKKRLLNSCESISSLPPASSKAYCRHQHLGGEFCQLAWLRSPHLVLCKRVMMLFRCFREIVSGITF